MVWSNLWRGKNSIELIGMKLVIPREEISKFDSFKFVPLLENQNDYLISGTQICSNGEFNISFKNFECDDFQLRNSISSQGYKHYYTDGAFDVADILLIECRLSDDILENKRKLTPYDRTFIMENQIRTVLNMVPLQTHDILTRELENYTQYDLTQPLEILQGQCYCDLVYDKTQLL